MKIKLGDTIKFNYNAPEVHDKSPVIFFLAKVGNLVHGLNQHYQSPQEKYYYYLLLKSVLYNKIKTGAINAQSFYKLYVKNRLITDSYRTYRYNFMSSLQLVADPWYSMTQQKIDIRRGGKYQTFSKGQRVKFVSMIKGKLSWSRGKVLGKKPPGNYYVIQTDKGELIKRHPSDLRLDI